MKDGALVDNPNKTWADVNPDLPAQDILAFIPGTKHGTREVFDVKVLEAGCEATGAEAALEAAGVEGGCTKLRTDGRSVDIDGDYTETLARIDSNKNGIGVFGLSFYENNTDKLQVATVNGVIPSTETIASAEYPVSRPLFFYVKKAHIGVIPGLKEFAEFFVSDDMAGPDGPLSAYGLVSDPELMKVQETVSGEVTMDQSM
jgi:phosphate transport system substrate-binding protein